MKAQLSLLLMLPLAGASPLSASVRPDSPTASTSIDEQETRTVTLEVSGMT